MGPRRSQIRRPAAKSAVALLFASMFAWSAGATETEPLALAERALDRFELAKAGAYVKQAVAEHGHSPQAYYLAARIETLEYRFDRAMDLSRRCIDEFPRAAACYESLGEARSLAMVREDRLLRQVKLAKRSVRDWQQALELDPGNIRARIQLIRYYRLAPWILGGSKRKAREQAQAIARIDPERAAEAYGMMSFYEEDWKDAVEHLGEAVARHPEDAELRYHLARARGERGQLAEAVKELAHIVERSPEFWEAWFHLGIWCVEAGADHAMCFDALETFVGGAVDSGEKRLANAYYAMGKLREHRGELDLALAAYEQALLAKHGHNESRDGVERLRPIVGAQEES